MPRIRCNYEGCIHLEGKLCTTDEIELNQELGCLTFSQVEEDAVAGVDSEIEEEWVGEVEEDEDDDDEADDWDDLDEDDDDDDDDEDSGLGSVASRRRRR